ncbi:MAG: AMIN domain-containing protein, partial [Methylococcales bacterium]|nr:AMIN domain-containing protein [Methylococcales bacterium]
MNMQKNKMRTLQKQSNYACLILGAWLLMLQVTSVWAGNTAITELNFSSLAGDKIQIQLGMNGPAVTPKVFQTDNPARIALDFAGVTSGLEKKLYSVNQGAAGAVYVVEASGRTRVVINLTETVPYETRVDGNKVYVVLKPISAIITTKTQVQEKQVDRKITRLLPEQTIKNIDFRRGPKGEGRLLLALSTPNTVVDVQERGGKVILNFLNTKLPDALVKRFDVADFATPVQTIDAQPRGAGVSISIATIDGNYDYSSYQSDGLLTVDFLPLTRAEKEAKLKEKFAYVGNKLSLNFQEIEVRAVLQILADFTDLNIVAADSVGGNVSLRLNDVPWDQALDLILKSKGLAKRRAGNVVMVAPIAEIIKIEEEELAANRVVEQLEPLRTEYIQINYAKAEDIQVLLVGSNVVTS